jgi:hypothetical protein
MKHETVISEVRFKGGYELIFKSLIPSEISFELKMFWDTNTHI